MSRLTWDDTGKKIYETGVDRGVLYLPNDQGVYATGVAWNGLTAVNESPDGAESNELYADNIKYADLISAEEFGFTIEAYTYPDEWKECDGSKAIATGVYAGQQTRKPFGFSYRTKMGNDVAGEDYGYKIHLIYGAKASPSDRDYETINDSPDAITFSWECTTTPVNVGDGFKPCATIEIDSTKATAEKLAALEEVLYGGDNAEPKLPTPAEIIALMS